MDNDTNYFQVYSHNLEFSLKVDGIDMTSVILATLSRGSAGGFFAEELSAAVLRNKLDHVPAKGHDFVSKVKRKEVECKSFNANGTDLSPSQMKGQGRKFDKELFEADARGKDFLIADTSNLANSFSYVVVPGDHVVDETGHRITAKRRSVLFGEQETPRPADW